MINATACLKCGHGKAYHRFWDGECTHAVGDRNVGCPCLSFEESMEIVKAEELELIDLRTPECGACHVPLATGECRHIYRDPEGHILMAEAEWNRLTTELSELRTLYADQR